MSTDDKIGSADYLCRHSLLGCESACQFAAVGVTHAIRRRRTGLPKIRRLRPVGGESPAGSSSRQNPGRRPPFSSMGDSTAMTWMSPTRNDLGPANRFVPLPLPAGQSAGRALRIVPTSSPVTVFPGLRSDHIMALRRCHRVLLLKLFRTLLRSVVHGITDAGLRPEPAWMCYFMPF